jgi:hypothetical protein
LEASHNRIKELEASNHATGQSLEASRNRIQELEAIIKATEKSLKTTDEFEGLISTYESKITELGTLLSGSILRKSDQDDKLKKIASLCTLLDDFSSKRKTRK